MQNTVFDLTQLPLSFPQTFLPDRDLLARLVRFTFHNGGGSKEAISDATGIPTGASTGKVEPMIRYAQGMGLMKAEKVSGVWRLELSSLGRIVYEQDAALSEPLTLWLLHLLLSRRCGLISPATGIADAWFTLFAEGALRLGRRFIPADYLNLLQERHGEKAGLKALSSLVLRTYLESRAFGGISVLKEEDGYIARHAAPVKSDLFPAYSVFFNVQWDEVFPGRAQLTFDEYSERTRFRSLTGWDESQVSVWLEWMASHGHLQLDRQTGTPVLLRLQTTEQVLAKLYDGFI